MKYSVLDPELLTVQRLASVLERSGIDASRRLVKVAQNGNPASDIRAGDMVELPWNADSFEVPFVFEFPDPETYARGLAATGPGYEAVQSMVQLFGYIGTKR
jgi:hypothetical protein